MRRPLLMIATVVALAQTAACTCAERTAEDLPPDPELLAHRVAPCEALCDAQVSECGPLPNNDITTHEQCVQECARPDGDLSAGWGYQQSTEKDGCIAEWNAHADCVLALACEQQKTFWSPAEQDPPFDERACSTEWRTMMDCVRQHPCCEEEGA